MTAASLRGYLVHAYTASTLIFVVLAVVWIFEGRFESALLAMAATVWIDATDGGLARRFRVKETATRVDGELLDNIVDFVSYVFLPVTFMVAADMLARPVVAFASVVVLASSYAFSRGDAKDGDDAFFAGFPSYWNVFVFYAYLMNLGPFWTSAAIVVLGIVSFSELRFLYVSRLRRGRAVHMWFGSAWGIALASAVVAGAGPVRTWLVAGSLVYVAVYTVHSLVADAASRRTSGGDAASVRFGAGE